MKSGADGYHEKVEIREGNWFKEKGDRLEGEINEDSYFRRVTIWLEEDSGQFHQRRVREIR